jgi:hypothetical protein
MPEEQIEQNIAVVPKKKNPFRILLLIIVPLVAVSVMVFLYEQRHSQPMLKNVLNGETDGKAISQVMKDLLDGIKNDRVSNDANLIALEEIDLLDNANFESHEVIQSTITVIEAAIEETKRYDDNLKELLESSKAIIQNSALSESEKASMLKGFLESASNPEANKINRDANLAVENYYTKVAELYRYMDKNFTTYKISADDQGVARIIFNSAAVAKQFELLNNEALALYQSVNDSTATAIENLNQKLDKSERGVGAEDVINFMDN